MSHSKLPSGFAPSVDEILALAREVATTIDASERLFWARPGATTLIYLRRGFTKADVKAALLERGYVAIDLDVLLRQLPSLQPPLVQELTCRLIDDTSSKINDTIVLYSTCSAIEDIADYAVFGPGDNLPVYARTRAFLGDDEIALEDFPLAIFLTPGTTFGDRCAHQVASAQKRPAERPAEERPATYLNEGHSEFE